MSKFIKLTDRETNKPMYVKKSHIQVVNLMSDYIVHKNDYDFERKKDSYDKDDWYTAIILYERVIVHVKETPEEIMKLIEEVEDE